MSIRFQTLLFFRFAILALLAGFSSSLFAYEGCAGRADLNTPGAACAYYHMHFFGGSGPTYQCKDDESGYIQDIACSGGSACPDGQTLNSTTGLCNAPPDPCPPVASSFTLTGSASEIRNAISGGSTTIGGCSVSHIQTPTAGNNCEQLPDGNLKCVFVGTPTGPATTANNPNATAITTPSQIGPTSTTNTNSGSGTTSTSTTSTVVNPNGSTTSSTTTQTTNNGSTTTSTSSTTISGPILVTTIGGTGGGTGGGNGTGNGTGDASGTGAGDCDPTATNYMECLLMLEQSPEDGGQSILDTATTGVQSAVQSDQDAQTGAIEGYAQHDSDFNSPAALADRVEQVLPSYSSCTEVQFGPPQHQFTVPCTRIETFKQVFGWFLGIVTVLYLYALAVKPIGDA